MATTTQVQVLYIAYFGRPADPDGLAFWANGSVGTNEELDQLADAFAETPEYLATIQGLSTKQIIDLFYENLFSRFAEQEGQDFWVSGIESGVLNPQDIGVDIGLAALNANPPNTDSQAIGAKADAADKYTKALEANPGDNARYSGAEGIKAGREYLDGVTDADTIPSDSEVESSVNGIGGGSGGGAALPGGGAQGNQGGIINGVLNLSVYEDVVNNQNTRQFEIVGGARGRQIATLPFALTTGNQSVAAVASDNAATNTLNALDSLVDASGTDSDNLGVAASGVNNLQRATVTNIENITFALNTYNGTLVSNTVGIAATGVDNFLTTGSLAAGNTAVIDATGSGATVINASGTTAAGATASFTLTAEGAGTALTGAAGNDTLNGAAGVDSFTGGLGDDQLSGGGSNDTFNVDAGTDTISDLGGGDILIVSAGGVAQATAGAAYTATSATTNLGTERTGAVITAAGNNVSLSAVNTGNGFTITNNGNAVGVILSGTTANDLITGGTGADTISGGEGQDTMAGGATATNTFRFGALADVTPNTPDVISDLDLVAANRLSFDGAGAGSFDLVGGNTLAYLEGAAGAFTATDNVVVSTTNAAAGAITPTTAAAAIGTSKANYTATSHVLFLVSNNTDSAVFYFSSAAADATVTPAELGAGPIISLPGVNAAELAALAGANFVLA